jgi:chemosensory pili system protein ChpC
MSGAADELYSLLVPLYQHRLLVPRASVAEVVRYADPQRAPAGASWLRALAHWNGREVPVICFEELAGLPFAPPGGRTRVAVFHGITGALESAAFGVLTEGFPQLVRINRDVMEPDGRNAWPEDGPVICQIRMINEYPLIPDLERLERFIAGVLDAQAEPA